MKDKIVCIFSNENKHSNAVKEILEKKFCQMGYKITDSCDLDSELVVCVGGDGAFLRALHQWDFPPIPFLGINTGHLGFFQEYQPENLDAFIDNYLKGRFSIQKLATASAELSYEGGKKSLQALNEIVIKSGDSHTVHLNISIADSFIERFSGDGICVATPAGSTGYNYSLGGSIIDPRLRVLQVTPIAPMNTTAYRSFTSSLVLPSELSIVVVPEKEYEDVHISTDSIEKLYKGVKELKVNISDKEVNLLRFENYDFWNKVKSKFL